MERTNLEKVVSGSVYLAVDLLLTSAMGAFFWIIVARIVPPNDVGMAATVIAFLTTLNVFANLGLPVAISKYVSEYNAQRRFDLSKSVFGFSIKIGLGVGVLVSILLLLFSGPISFLIYQNPELGSLMAFAAILVPFQVIGTSLSGFYQGCQKMEFCLIGDAIVAVSKFGAVLLMVIVFSYKALGILSAVAIGTILSCVTGYFFLIPRCLLKVDNNSPMVGQDRVMRGVLAFSFPNYISGIFGTLSTQLGIMLLGIYSLSSVAYYNIASLIFSMLIGVVGSVATALLPTVSEQWIIGSKSGVSDLLNLVVRLSLAVSGPFLLGASLFSKEVLALISPLYTPASPSLQILTFSVFFGALGLSATSVLNGIGNAKASMKVVLLSSLGTIMVTVISVPIFGMVGAAVAILAGYLLRVTVGTFLLYKEGIKLEAMSLLRPAAPLAISFITGSLLYSFFGDILITFFVVMLVYLTSAYLVKAISLDEINFLIKTIFGGFSNKK